MAYTPFDKAFTDLDEEQLLKLITNRIDEGWYIEYKQELPKQGGKIDGSKIAKSISAFANTKGGWLFYGIKEEKPKSFELSGISLEQDSNIVDSLSQVISGNINPTPIFFIKAISLLNGNNVVVIKVDESPLPPYVTSGGSIYQRENSESKPVIDRYIIQKLTEKADSYYEKINGFCQVDYHQSKEQSKTNQAFLEIYLFPIPFGTFDFKDFDEPAFFNKVVKTFGDGASVKFGKPDQPSFASLNINMNLNAFTTSTNSIIIRSISEETIMHKGMSIELFENGNVKFHIPINEFDFQTIPSQYKNSKIIDFLLNKYPQTEYYNSSYIKRETKESEFVTKSKMLDGGNLLMSIFIFGEQLKSFLENSDFDLKKIKFGFRAKVTGLWRKFIFLDDPNYLEKVKSLHIPISAKENIHIPSRDAKEYYILNLSNEYPLLPLGIWILQSIGVPNLSSEDIVKIFTHILFKQPIS